MDMNYTQIILLSIFAVMALLLAANTKKFKFVIHVLNFFKAELEVDNRPEKPQCKKPKPKRTKRTK